MQRWIREMASLTLRIILLTGTIASYDAGFAPSPLEENTVTKCLLCGKSGQMCFGRETASRQKPAEHRPRKLSPSDAVENYPVLDSTTDYIFALNAYQNILEGRGRGHRRREFVNAVSAAASCARYFNSVSRTWRHKLSDGGKEIRVSTPNWEYRNGTTVIVEFVTGTIANRYPPDSLKGVDMIISRSHAEDVEVSGKYNVKVSIKERNGDRLLVHDTVQGTCPSFDNRYFVAGLELNGLEKMSQWLSNESNTIEFRIDVIAQRQIIRGSGQRTEYIKTEFDIGQRVSGIILHFSTLQSRIVPLPFGMLYARGGRAARKKRSLSQTDAGSCRLEAYHVNYRSNPKVLRPTEFNLGECVGSCNRALQASSDLHFNASNHALSMLLENQKLPKPSDPEPTVCCIPIKYRKMYFVTMDERGLTMSTYAEDMVAEYCGCR